MKSLTITLLFVSILQVFSVSFAHAGGAASSKDDSLVLIFVIVVLGLILGLMYLYSFIKKRINKNNINDNEREKIE